MAFAPSIEPARAWAAPRERAARLERAVLRVLPGLALTAIVALVAHVAAASVFPYALAIGFEVPLAMILGIVVIAVVRTPAWAMPGVAFAVKNVLRLGIILLGLRLNLQTIVLIGANAILLVLALMACALAFAVFVGRRLGVPRRVAILIGVGTAVCGNSAILAAAPIVKADDREASFAVATITIFGTLAVFVFPLVGHALALDVLTQGLWAGTAVPDTAQTIAASAASSTVGRDVATVVKLVRNVMMAPLLLLIAWGWGRYGDDVRVSARTARRGALKAFPLFLLGFLALALVRTERLVDPETVAHVDVVTRACFIVALAALGMQTRLDAIRALGLRPFLLGLGTAVLLAGASLGAITALGLQPARTTVVGGSDPRPLGGWTTVCARGAAPAFAGAFQALAEQLGGRMGAPRGCATTGGGSQDTVQRTTRGVATLSRATGRARFSDGRRSWTIRGSRLLAWSGPAVAPPAGAVAAPLAPARGVPAGLHARRLEARVLATGIPGAGALSPVGEFHPGSPIHDKRAFAAATASGKVLDATRLLVASTSNFGAPAARADWAPGAILSLATDARAPLRPPPGFAAAGGQAQALGGAAQLYAAQSPAFLNRSANAGAVTADMPAVSNPLGISVNDAFGRPWIANAPTAGGPGAESVLDPDGRPLADPPSDRAGGVFAGRLTDRDPQRRPGGLSAGVLGNALLGASPDVRPSGTSRSRSGGPRGPARARGDGVQLGAGSLPLRHRCGQRRGRPAASRRRPPRLPGRRYAPAAQPLVLAARRSRSRRARGRQPGLLEQHDARGRRRHVRRQSRLRDDRADGPGRPDRRGRPDRGPRRRRRRGRPAQRHRRVTRRRHDLAVAEWRALPPVGLGRRDPGVRRSALIGQSVRRNASSRRRCCAVRERKRAWAWRASPPWARIAAARLCARPSWR